MPAVQRCRLIRHGRTQVHPGRGRQGQAAAPAGTMTTRPAGQFAATASWHLNESRRWSRVRGDWCGAVRPDHLPRLCCPLSLRPPRILARVRDMDACSPALSAAWTGSGWTSWSTTLAPVQTPRLHLGLHTTHTVPSSQCRRWQNRPQGPLVQPGAPPSTWPCHRRAWNRPGNPKKGSSEAPPLTAEVDSSACLPVLPGSGWGA